MTDMQRKFLARYNGRKRFRFTALEENAEWRAIAPSMFEESSATSPMWREQARWGRTRVQRSRMYATTTVASTRPLAVWNDAGTDIGSNNTDRRVMALVYLELFNGRRSIDEQMRTFGTKGLSLVPSPFADSLR